MLSRLVTASAVRRQRHTKDALYPMLPEFRKRGSQLVDGDSPAGQNFRSTFNPAFAIGSELLPAVERRR